MAVSSKGNYGSKPGPKAVGPKPRNSDEKAAAAWTQKRNQAVKNLGAKPRPSDEKAYAARMKSYDKITGGGSKRQTSSMGRGTRGR
jgi:hypothetical protein